MYRRKKLGSIAAVKKLKNIKMQVIKNRPINISTMTKVKPIAKSLWHNNIGL